MLIKPYQEVEKPRNRGQWVAERTKIVTGLRLPVMNNSTPRKISAYSKRVSFYKKNEVVLFGSQKKETCHQRDLVREMEMRIDESMLYIKKKMASCRALTRISVGRKRMQASEGNSLKKLKSFLRSNLPRQPPHAITKNKWNSDSSRERWSPQPPWSPATSSYDYQKQMK